jgi:hypothetical protein
MSEVRSAESFLKISGQPAPPAYLFITKQPYHYNPTAIVGAPVIGALGFKIPDFQHPGPVTFRDIVLGKRTHSEMHELIDSLRRHTEPPATFDGSAPELTFGDASHLPPLLIGNQYLIPDGSGGETEGILQSATMVESEKRAYGIYRIAGERHVIATTPMTDVEIAAWRRHPETFFGKVQPITEQVESPLDLAELEISPRISKRMARTCRAHPAGSIAGRIARRADRPADLPVGQISELAVESLLQKYFASPVGQIISTNSRHPVPH